MAVRVETLVVFLLEKAEPCWSGSSSGRWLAQAVAAAPALVELQMVLQLEVFG